MSKFKVGDRIRAVKTQDPYFKAGDVGTITGFFGGQLDVKFDVPRLENGQWCVREDQAEILRSEVLSEFEAMRKCSEALEALSEDQRGRVICYLEDRFV